MLLRGWHSPGAATVSEPTNVDEAGGRQRVEVTVRHAAAPPGPRARDRRHELSADPFQMPRENLPQPLLVCQQHLGRQCGFSQVAVPAVRLLDGAVLLGDTPGELCGLGVRASLL